MCHIYLETENFYIRQWKIEDVEELHKIMNDSRVHTYTGDKPWTLERTNNYINYMLDKSFRTLETFHGACVLKSSNSIIGLTGLNPYKPKQPEIEWQFGTAYWEKGYRRKLEELLSGQPLRGE